MEWGYVLLTASCLHPVNKETEPALDGKPCCAMLPLPRSIGAVALSLEQCESGAHPGD
jgi:hypothetical protein